MYSLLWSIYQNSVKPEKKMCKETGHVYHWTKETSGVLGSPIIIHTQNTYNQNPTCIGHFSKTPHVNFFLNILLPQCYEGHIH